MASTSKDHLGMAADTAVPAQLSASPATVLSISAAQQTDDEARKKNTDCVYFLASPLTCKKGSECEYRHSEYARVNPRDCWFWMNANCLNPKCSFRHPPLDSLMGSQTAGSPGSSVMGSSGSSSAPSQAIHSTSFTAAKQAAPCIFFQKGYCLKGDFCPFSHTMPYPTNSKLSQIPSSSSSGVSDSLGFKKLFGGVEKCSQTKPLPLANVSKPLDVLSASKASVKLTPELVKNGASAKNYGRNPPIGAPEEHPKQKMTTSHSSFSGSLRTWSGHTTNHHATASSLEEQSFQNGKEIDDSLRESSPGFDVLVDDERGGPNYYGDKDRFTRTRDHDGRSVNEFLIGYQDDYKSASLEMYNDMHDYNKHQERYVWDHIRSSSERPLVESVHSEQRAGLYKGETLDRIENVDLRHHLSKHKQGCMRSVVSHDYVPENRSEERHYKSSRSLHPPYPESSLGSRLQGRIRFPGKSSPASGAIEEHHRTRKRGKLSPTMLNHSSYRGRVQDRLSGRVQQDDVAMASMRTRRDVIDDQDTNFAPPKSLAELKRSKQVHSKERLPGYVDSISLGKRKAIEGSIGTDGDASFEGPKPLSEILKKKRGGASSTIDVPGPRQRSTSRSQSAAPADEQGVDSSSAMDHVNLEQIDKEENKSIQEDGNGTPDSSKTHKSAGTVSPKLNANANERSVNSGAEGDEYGEGYGQGEEGAQGDGDGEYEYEQEDGDEEYNPEEGENGALAEYMDEDDGDDFAKKIGVMFS